MNTQTIILAVMFLYSLTGATIVPHENNNKTSLKETPNHILTVGSKTYMIYTEIPKTLLRAYSFCKDRDEDLIAIESVEENQYLFNTLLELFQTSAYVFWTSALRSTSSTSDWIWLSNGKAISQYYWLTGEPSNYTEQRGITLNFGLYSSRAWWQSSNVINNHSVICEK